MNKDVVIRENYVDERKAQVKRTQIYWKERRS